VGRATKAGFSKKAWGMGSSKVTDAIKHPVWISVGTVVGVLALVVAGFTYLRANGSSGDGLTVAAVTLGTPINLGGVEEGATGYPEDRRPTNVSAAPVDITFKNAGSSTAGISSVTAQVLKGVNLNSCLQQGAGASQILAEYALKVPARQLFDEGAAVDPVSDPIDFKVEPGETGRLAVTVGPDGQYDNNLIVMAVRLVFQVDDGTTVETEPLVIGTTEAIIDQFVSDAANNGSGRRYSTATCAEQLAKINDVTRLGESISEPVQRLLKAYQHVS